MAKGFLRALGLGVAFTAAITLSNFGAKEESAEKAVQTCQQIFVQMQKQNNYDKREYKRKCDIIERGIIIDIQNLYGNAKSKQQRIEWERNLIAGYRSNQNNNFSDFETPLKILQKNATADWKEFTGNSTQRAQSANQRFMEIQTALLQSYQKLQELSTIEHKKQTNTQWNQHQRKIEINQYTLNNSYQLFEWYREYIFLKIELWRCNNPIDANATNLQFQEFKKIVDQLDFSQFKTQ